MVTKIDLKIASACIFLEAVLVWFVSHLVPVFRIENVISLAYVQVLDVIPDLNLHPTTIICFLLDATDCQFFFKF